jgi:hypothetical protein
MSEILNNDSEYNEESVDSEREAAELAAAGLARAIEEERADDDQYEDEYDDEYDDQNEDEHEDEYDDQYEDEYDDEWNNDEQDDDDGYDYEDDYYNDWHNGEIRADYDEDFLTFSEFELPKELKERYKFLEDLPHGVAVMGGVARSIAREIITGEAEPIRDIDLVNIVSEEGGEIDPEMRDELSKKYMPDDYAFGHGMGRDTFENYFKTRDFTINQCLVMDGKLIVSNLAYNDFKENIIRPTFYEQRWDGDTTRSRIFLKALMMRSVLSQVTDSIPLVEDINEPYEIRRFDVALALNKAMSRGARTARTFAGDLADWGVVGEEYAFRPMALAKKLMRVVYKFEFRPNNDPRFEDIEEYSDMDGYFVPKSMNEYYSSDKEIRQAMAEYEDNGELPDSDFEIIDSEKERLRGHYSQAEYDEINSCAPEDHGGWYYD